MSTNDPFLDRADNGPVFTTATEPVRWWIPLVASTGALLVMVLGAAALVSGAVNATLDGMLG
ncbi:hypothetical protein ACFQHV_01965 [Promicromonospora thailandica]|uniref:hypothetical protein n=1 Tax=Promicromonospora thailandica TaxID=765201 RepID=UPI0020A5A914|nr:hypothetical protein [Promicromonospora thailandica]